MPDYEILIEILESFLGDAVRHTPSRGQISFDCPVCSFDIKGLDDGDGKGNLEINYQKNVYKCWACSETNYTHGRIQKLIKKYGSDSDLSQFNLIFPDSFGGKSEEIRLNRLPEEFISFQDSNKNSLQHKQAVNYLYKRGITDDMIQKYRLGYATSGVYKFRIIAPSFDKNNRINYFVARSYVKTKLKYKNPEASKELIIFNEHLIDWRKDVYLVEGVFDMFFLDNAIPILGKVISDKLWQKLYEDSQSDIIICLDGDAWRDGVKLYDKLNGGKLRGRIKIVKMPKDKDVADLGGKINKENIVSLEKN